MDEKKDTVTVTISCQWGDDPCHATETWQAEKQLDEDEKKHHHPNRTPPAGWALAKDRPYDGSIARGYCPEHADDAVKAGLVDAYPAR